MRITQETTSQDLENPLLDDLRAWHHEAPRHLLDFLLLVRTYRAGVETLEWPDPRLATNAVLLEALEQLESQNGSGVRLLRERF